MVIRLLLILYSFVHKRCNSLVCYTEFKTPNGIRCVSTILRTVKGHGNYKLVSICAMGDTSKRGFASMDPVRQREISRKGGKASHSGGFASMDPEKQRQIARKGGKASHGGGRRVATNW